MVTQITKSFFKETESRFFFSSAEQMTMYDIFLFINYDAKKDKITYAPLFTNLQQLNTKGLAYTISMQNFIGEHGYYWYQYATQVAIIFATYLKSAIIN